MSKAKAKNSKPVNDNNTVTNATPVDSSTIDNAQFVDGIPDHIVFNKKPWHGFGYEIQPGQTIHDLMKHAGLDFEVAVSPIHYGGSIVSKQPNESFTEFQTRQIEASTPKYFTDSRRALFRTDTGLLFDTPRSGYHPIQNKDMIELFEEYVKAGQMKIETMGSFADGRKNWILADMDMGFDANGKTIGGDVILGKILLYFPHIYGESAYHKTTSISVVCSNTLDAARKQKSDKTFSLWHNTAWSTERSTEAKMNLELSRKQFLQLKDDVEILSQVKLSQSEAEVLLVLSVGDKNRKIGDQNRAYSKIMDLYENSQPGVGLESRKGTAWGLLNAVTYFNDWAYGTQKTSQSARLERSWFGLGHSAKTTTREVLYKFANGQLATTEMVQAADIERELRNKLQNISQVTV